RRLGRKWCNGFGNRLGHGNRLPRVGWAGFYARSPCNATGGASARGRFVRACRGAAPPAAGRRLVVHFSWRSSFPWGFDRCTSWFVGSGLRGRAVGGRGLGNASAGLASPPAAGTTAARRPLARRLDLRGGHTHFRAEARHHVGSAPFVRIE